MKKNYIAPSMKVREIDMESNLLGNSPAINAKPFSGLEVFSGDAPVEYGGTATNGSAGDAGAGAKFGNVWESWGGDEEE